MQEKLKLLYNTLKTIETKGDSTITMADCMRFLGQCIKECEKEEEKKREKKSKAKTKTEATDEGATEEGE